VTIVHRFAPAALLFAIAASLLGAAPPASAATTLSPAAEMVVVTVNAQQRDYDDARMRALTERLVVGTPMLPDAILVDEILGSGVAAMRDQLNARVGSGTYAIAGTTSSVKVKILLNAKAMKFVGYRTWNDACAPDERTYQIVIADEIATGRRVAVAGVHFAPSFNNGGSDECKKLNAEEARRQMARYADSGIVGDFNKRVTSEYYECNPDEVIAPESPAQPWYTAMTAPSAIDGRSYHDTVRAAHYGKPSMRDQWSWEDTVKSPLCNGDEGYRRSRLDYIFASQQMSPIDAATDQGWTSANDGPVCTTSPGCRYSDHRFLWARLGLSIPTSHIGDLDASRAKVTGGWTASATATVHDTAEAAVGGATVAYSWINGSTNATIATGTCTTTSTGSCKATSPKLSTTLSSVKFTVANVTRTGWAYDAGRNHDPESDSNGTTITVLKP
jgi:endonuclease/exonuclease/phosphatase family metal-dependent hydrolase